MNTTITTTSTTTRLAPRLSHRIAALASAAFFTLVLLAGIDGLATSEPKVQLVQATAAAKA